MTAKDRATLKAENVLDLGDNAAGEITPADLRGQLDDIIDSAVFPEDGITGGGGTTVYALVASVGAEIIPVDVKSIRTGGYTVLGSGGARYSRMAAAPVAPLDANRGVIRSADRFTAAGAIDAINGGWWMLDIEQTVYITMFGGEIRTAAQSDGGGLEPINDAAVAHAQVFCANVRPGYFVPLVFPAGRFRISTTVPLVAGMNWRGEGVTVGSDTENTATIYNNDDDMFSHTVTLRDVYFTGLDFDAATIASDILSNGGTTTFELQWSKFQFCAFKNARYGIRLSATGVVIKNCFFQGCNISLEMNGSDNYIQDNFIDTSHPVLAGAITLSTCALSTVRGNFITGRHKIPLVIRGNCQGTRIYDNEFDISDYSGVFSDHGRGYTLFANTFNRLTVYQDPDLAVIATLGSNPLTTVASSPLVSVTHSSSNFVVAGQTVSFAGATAVNGITVSGTYTITSITDPTHFVITHGSNASASGAGGGTTVVMTIPERPAPADASYSNIINPAVAGVYADAEFRAHDSYNFNLHDNIFMNAGVFVPPTGYPATHKLTSSTTSAPGDDLGGRAGHDVYIDDVNYRDGKRRNIVLGDLNICAPRLGSRHPSGILNITTASTTIVVRPGEYSVIVVNIATPGATTITIANYLQDSKDAETIFIHRRDANAYTLTIRTGDAAGAGTSTTIKTFVNVAGNTTAIYDGTVWFCT